MRKYTIKYIITENFEIHEIIFVVKAQNGTDAKEIVKKISMTDQDDFTIFRDRNYSLQIISIEEL